MPRDCPGVNATSYSYFGFSPDHPFCFPVPRIISFRGWSRSPPLAAALAITGRFPPATSRFSQLHVARRYFFSYLLLLFSFCPRNCALTVFCRYFPLFSYFSSSFFLSLPFSSPPSRWFRASSSFFFLSARTLSLSLSCLVDICRWKGAEGEWWYPFHDRPSRTTRDAKRGKICIRTGAGRIALRRGDHLYHVPTDPLLVRLCERPCVVTADVHRAA